MWAWAWAGLAGAGGWKKNLVSGLLVCVKRWKTKEGRPSTWNWEGIPNDIACMTFLAFLVFDCRREVGSNKNFDGGAKTKMSDE